MSAFADGDRVLLLEPSTGHKHLVVLDGDGARKQRGLGVFDPGRLVGLEPGSPVQIAGKDLVALRPTPADLARTLKRKAQIITPKDAGRIVFELGLGPGDRVLESGIGSGAATLAMAHAVGADGQVVVQELRQDFIEWATDNLRLAGVADRVETHLGDLTEGVADGIAGPFDACLLDQPEPWLALPQVWPHLAPGARVAAYCPQVSQMEKTVRVLRELGCADVVSMETIERVWEVKDLGSRPSFDGLGFTAFLVFGRWPGQPGPSSPPAES